MKKRFIILCTFVLLLGFSKPAHALESFITYEEKGQVIFDDVKLGLEEEKLKILGGSNQRQETDLRASLSDPEIEKILSECLAQGKTPVVIGWTSIYLKENTATNDLVPATAVDVVNNAGLKGVGNGAPTIKGNFRLYTIAGYDNYAPTEWFANSKGRWSSGTAGSNGPANDNDDFISITWPSGQVIRSSGLGGAVTNPYKNNEKYSSVVWGFREKVGEANLSSNGRISGTGTKKWVSKYVHTWATTVPSFSISTTGVSITLTNTGKSWQVASSVVY